MGNVGERSTRIPFENITVIHGDTDAVKSGEITGGSRSVQIGGTNVWRAAGVVADKARQIASRLLEASVDDVVLEDGRFHVAGTPAVTRTWADVVATAQAMGSVLMVKETLRKHQAHSRAALILL